jgi:hypothetical protein
MAGSTLEAANDDVKALRDDPHKFNDGLAREILRLNISVEKLSAEFHYAKWLLFLLLVTVFVECLAGVWWAANITSDLRAITKTLDQAKLK